MIIRYVRVHSLFPEGRRRPTLSTKSMKIVLVVLLVLALGSDFGDANASCNKLGSSGQRQCMLQLDEDCADCFCFEATDWWIPYQICKNHGRRRRRYATDSCDRLGSWGKAQCIQQLDKDCADCFCSKATGNWLEHNICYYYGRR